MDCLSICSSLSLSLWFLFRTSCLLPPYPWCPTPLPLSSTFVYSSVFFFSSLSSCQLQFSVCSSTFHMSWYSFFALVHASVPPLDFIPVTLSVNQWKYSWFIEHVASSFPRLSLTAWFLTSLIVVKAEVRINQKHSSVSIPWTRSRQEWTLMLLSTWSSQRKMLRGKIKYMFLNPFFKLLWQEPYH